MKQSLDSMCLNIVDCEHKTSPIDEFGEFFAVGTPAMRGNVIDFGQARRISEETFKAWTRRLRPKYGDLLFAREAPVGPVVLIPQEENVAAGQRTVLLRPDPKQLNTRFLYYLLSSPIQQRQIESLAAGSTVAHLNVADVRSLELQVPPIAEQQAIADVLGALDDKIAANAKLSRSIDQFLAAYYSRITKNSPTVPLGEIASVNPETCKPLVGGSLRYIDISSVGQGSYEFPEISSWDDAPSRARRQVRSGDTLWSTVRPNRRSHALNLSSDELLVGSTGLAVLRPYGIGYSYLYESTKTPEFSAYLENVAEGSAYPAVRANRFEDAPISWPESAARDSFEMTADPLRKMQHSNEVENQYLASIRDALLPQLMSGKLRVKDAEALVESVV